MDSFELARLRAAALHDELVAAGADATKPLALVRAAAARFSYELTFLEAGDPALKGARALFDHQSGTICCVDAGSDSARALLVAHELGHAVIHPGSITCHDHDIDPARSTEAVPVGLQKVEDYGVRERRELEANVFAREFLLPRPMARRRHATEGETAADIARTLDLPVPLVRQQILDALLLPVLPPPAEAARSPVFAPDPAQDTAADHRGTPFLLRAGPGTGKTRTLVKRVQSLLAEHIQPASILALTFSNRTARELSERLAKVLPDTDNAIWVGTFHGFGLDLVRRFHDRLDLPPDPTLFDRSDAISVLEQILPTLSLAHYRNLWDPVIDLREILQSISRAKDELTDPQQYHAFAERMAAAAEDDKARETAAKCLDVATVYEHYEAAKHARGAVDFGDLIMLPALLLERDEVARAAVRLRHRHVLVDEYQDVNRASVRLVKAVVDDGRNLWCVGDARQSIYRFRGASAANMATFVDDFLGATLGQLGISYRSTQQILDTFGTFSAGMPLPPALANLPLNAARGSGPVSPEIRTLLNPDEENAGIAASVRELEAAGVALRDQAILCRTNDRLNEVAEALENRDIPVLHLGSLFEREEIRDLLSLLSLAADRFGAGFVRIAGLPRYAIPAQDVKHVLAHLSDAADYALARLPELVTLPTLSTEGRVGIVRLAEDLKGFKPSALPWDLLTAYLLDRTDQVRVLAAGPRLADRMRAIAVWQFLNFLRDQSPVATGSPIQTLLDRVRNLVLLAEERDLRQVPDAALQMNAVRLMTIHGSKGLEFDAVHIPGFVKTGIPSSFRAGCPVPQGMVAGAAGSVDDDAHRSHSQEQECLFFVAMSRAKTHLHLYAHQRQANGNNREASDFLPRLGSTIRRITAPAIIPLPAPAPERIAIAFPENWECTHEHVSSYKKCPRRFFYTHVLGIGTARRTTDFERTHSCIYEFIDWLAEERLSTPPGHEAAQAAFDAIWAEKGPHDSAYVTDYRALAGRLVNALVDAGAGRRFREAAPLVINYRNGTVVLTPDEITERSDGIIAIRKVRTGRRRKTEFTNLDYALYQRAAQQNFGPTAVVEAVHPSDAGVETVPTPKSTKTSDAKVETILQGIASGAFPPDADPFSCPRCPHFFICAATPRGPIAL